MILRSVDSEFLRTFRYSALLPYSKVFNCKGH